MKTKLAILILLFPFKGFCLQNGDFLDVEGPDINGLVVANSWQRFTPEDEITNLSNQRTGSIEGYGFATTVLEGSSVHFFSDTNYDELLGEGDYWEYLEILAAQEENNFTLPSSEFRNRSGGEAYITQNIEIPVFSDFPFGLPRSTRSLRVETNYSGPSNAGGILFIEYDGVDLHYELFDGYLLADFSILLGNLEGILLNSEGVYVYPEEKNFKIGIRGIHDFWIDGLEFSSLAVVPEIKHTGFVITLFALGVTLASKKRKSSQKRQSNVP